METKHDDQRAFLGVGLKCDVEGTYFTYFIEKQHLHWSMNMLRKRAIFLFNYASCV